MKKFVCEVCGSYEYVEEKGRCRCAYCNAMYTQEYLDKDEVLRIAENAILAQEKRKLYDLVQAKYSDGSAIIHACKGILAIKPDDRYADFYGKVYKAQTQKSDENIEAVNKYLLNLDVHKEENAYFVQDVLACMIKNLQLKTVLSLSFLMEELEKTDLLSKAQWETYQTKIEAVVTDLREGVYNVHKERDAFVMYSSKDMEKVYALVKYLEDERGIQCFVSARNLRHGGDAVRNFGENIRTAIDYCDVVVLVSSKHSCSETCYTMKEMEYILRRERGGAPKKPRVEYLLGERQKTREVADSVAGKIVEEFFQDLNWRREKSQLANAIIDEQENLKNAAKMAATAAQKEVKYCKECGAENGKRVKFCGECGNREFVDTYEAYEEVKRAEEARKKAEEEAKALAEKVKALQAAAQKEVKYCKACGAENEKKVKFCGECGNKEFVATQEEYAKIKEEARKPTQAQIEEWCQKGKQYYSGDGVGQNYAEAVKWYQKAAEQGHAESQYWLGNCYYFGYGVEQDSVKAVEWYKKATEQGYAWAQYGLGYCYYLGFGVEKEYTEAVKWYQKAAQQGLAAAQYQLGFCYYNGEGVEEDKTEAVKWYKKAAEQGHADAQYELGDCYYWGGGVEEDYAEAVKWYRKAADQGFDVAQYSLGECYYNGWGVEKDKAEAKKWWQKAATQGDEDAKSDLKEYFNISIE